MKPQAVALCLGLLGGCASNPRVTVIVSGTPVAFEVVMSQPALEKATVRDTFDRRVSSSGATAGAVAGGLYGLTCGPFAVLCMPVTMLVGAGVGGVLGMSAGLAESLPEEKRTRLEDRLRRLQQSVDPVVELRTEVLERAGKHWQLTDDTSMWVVTLEVQSLFLTSDRRENVSLVMEVLVSQRQGESGSPSPPAAPRRYAVASQGTSLAIWLEEHNALPEILLSIACEQIATQVVSDLVVN